MGVEPSRMGLVTLYQKPWRTHSPPCKDSHLWTRKPLPGTVCQGLDLGLPSLQDVREKLLLFVSSQTMVFWHSSRDGQRQRGINTGRKAWRKEQLLQPFLCLLWPVSQISLWDQDYGESYFSFLALRSLGERWHMGTAMGEGLRGNGQHSDHPDL